MNVKKTGILICLMIAVLAGFGFFMQDVSRAANETGTVAADSGLNVRKSAELSADSLGTLENGAAVTILDTVKDSSGNSWYKITATVDGASVTGYVYAAYIVKDSTSAAASPSASASSNGQTMYRTETVYSPILVAAKVIVKVPVYKTAAGARKVISKKKVTLKVNKKVKVVKEKTVSGQKWFRIRFKLKGKTRYGYVKNTYIQMTAKNITAKIFNTTKKIKIRTKAGTSASYLLADNVKVKVKKGAAVTILKDTKCKKKSARWYRISFTYKGATKKGYIHSKYVKLVKKATSKSVAITALSDAEFEASMTEQGFPEDYKVSLRALHQTYPFWQFRAYKTGLKWSDVIAAESKLGENLISNSKSAAWKSTEAGAYNSSTGKWVVFDGSSWVAASKKAICYYMDPRNFLKVSTIFQFELLEYQSQYQTSAGVDSILKTTPFGGKSFTYSDISTGKSRTISYTNTFLEAAKESGVSPYHLASRVKQEVVTSATTTSSAVTGKHSTYPGIYNFYNIGASSGSNPVANGLKWASSGTTYLRPWKDQYRSIVGGATYIGSSYINKGQNTLYLQKFNVTSYSRYGHQYMTNVEAAYSEALKTKAAYGESVSTTPIVFSIPVYENMPDTVSPIPS